MCCSPVISGYGPALDIDLDIENDLNIPDLDNPIDDIDLGNGQVVNRPELAAATADLEEEDEPDTAFVALCEAALLRSEEEVAHPADCTKFLSCQHGLLESSGARVLVTVRDCSPGTVWDTETNRCNHRNNVPRCQTGQQIKYLKKFSNFFLVILDVIDDNPQVGEAV